MKSLLVVLGVVGAHATTAFAARDLAIEPLQLVVQVPDGGGTWVTSKKHSEPGRAVLVAITPDETSGDASVEVAETPATSLTCDESFAMSADEYEPTTAGTSGDYGLDATWSTTVRVFAADAQGAGHVLACHAFGGRLLVADLDIVADAAGQSRIAVMLNALTTAWDDRFIGVQQLVVDAYALRVVGQETPWFQEENTPNVFFRAWGEPELVVKIERSATGHATPDDSVTCETWITNLGAEATISTAASFLPAGWYADAVVQTEVGEAFVVICIPRQDGGTLLAQIVYNGDVTAADFDRALRPLLVAIAQTAGVPPAVIETVPGTYEPTTVGEPTVADPTPDDADKGWRDPYDASKALLVTASYLRLAPSTEGVDPGAGFALAVDRPALPADAEDHFAWVWTGRASAGYDPEAGIIADARIAGGYHFGSERAAWILLGGAGADMIDHGAEDAPFHARLAAYAYVGAIFRYAPSERLTLEVTPATLQRAGIYEALEVTGRATIRRGGHRKLSIDVGFRRYDGDGMNPDADLLSIGLGIGL